jgi:hypothetical protein
MRVAASAYRNVSPKCGQACDLLDSLDQMATHGPTSQIDPNQPKSVCLFAYWQIRSVGGDKTITCAAYEMAQGFEIRVQYSDQDVIATKRFQGPEARARMDAYAAEARTEIEKYRPSISG